VVIHSVSDIGAEGWPAVRDKVIKMLRQGDEYRKIDRVTKLEYPEFTMKEVD